MATCSVCGKERPATILLNDDDVSSARYIAWHDSTCYHTHCLACYIREIEKRIAEDEPYEVDLKFDHKYTKFCTGNFDLTTRGLSAWLYQIFVVDKTELSSTFIDYDTAWYNTDTQELEYYQLPGGKLIVLLLRCGAFMLTTCRKWTPEKETYYRGRIGKPFKIVVEKK